MSSTTSQSEKSAAPQGSPTNGSNPIKRGNNGDGTQVEVQTIPGGGGDDDEAELARMGYKQEFAREFTNLSVRYTLSSL